MQPYANPIYNTGQPVPLPELHQHASMLNFPTVMRTCLRDPTPSCLLHNAPALVHTTYSSRQIPTTLTALPYHIKTLPTTRRPPTPSRPSTTPRPLPLPLPLKQRRINRHTPLLPSTTPCTTHTTATSSIPGLSLIRKRPRMRHPRDLKRRRDLVPRRGRRVLPLRRLVVVEGCLLLLLLLGAGLEGLRVGGREGGVGGEVVGCGLTLGAGAGGWGCCCCGCGCWWPGGFLVVGGGWHGWCVAVGEAPSTAVKDRYGGSDAVLKHSLGRYPIL
ncbi:hypothetical protein BDV96DRAFT_1126 [Lophiotrema nucula]|uniref:Uncharacterized protein n=1 Tax=Lophiotrema nucula TaxID=690887 RepID=A0A6A5ZU97_9PLEO|nr:hypothetical protein BDV96DRAFT_1126 [Lophiotrema nucula]